MVEPFHGIVACSGCGNVYSRRKAPKCPVCSNSSSSRIEDPSD